MHTIHLTTDTADNAKLLVAFLSNVKTVKSVYIEPVIQEKYNWINPSRPATDKEFERMITESGKGKGLTLAEAKKLSIKKVNKWIKKEKLK